MTKTDRLESIGEQLWLAEGPIVDFYGFPYPTRMLVVRLPDGDLWVWSPIAPDEALKKEMDDPGRVAHLVSPNKLHHLFLGDWHKAWPEAKLWGPPSTIKKCPDLPFQPALAETPPPDWQGALEMFHMKGSPFFEELVFFHKASKTVIIGDLSENFSDSFLKAHWKGWKYRIGRHWGIVEGQGHAPLEVRLSWWRRKKAREKMRKLIAMKPEQVVMAHGVRVKEDGEAFLRKAFDWLV